MEPIDPGPVSDPCLIEHAGQYRMTSVCEIITVSSDDMWIFGILGITIGFLLGGLIAATFGN